MPGVVARIGGRPPQPEEIDGVLAYLRHFHFYGSETGTSERGWLGWAGIGAGDRRVLPTPGGRKLVVHDGDGAAWQDDAQQRAVAASIAELIAERPYDLAARLGGSFSASCLDLESGEFHCVTDLFGHRRVYYRQLGETLYLAGELKAFLGWPEFPVEADPAALRDLMNYSYPLGDRTSLAGVKLLQPASQLSFRDGVLAVKRYWRPRYQPQEGDDDQLCAEGYRLFSETFARKTAGAPRLIVPVSGGLDSRMLLCEALETGADPYTYTFGHARSSEAAMSCRIMEHLGVEPRHIRTDDFPDAVRTLQRTSWFGEGMVDTGTALITQVAGAIGEDPQRALFVNGIYGGPTNFSNLYHRPDELVAQMPAAEKIARIGRTMFSSVRRSAYNYQKLQPDFARECDTFYDQDIARLLPEYEGVSTLFGYQKDAFFIDNRLCRFMNQVDLNRYFWDEVIALTSVPLYEFYLRLPDRLKFGRLLHLEILASRFPHAAAAPVFQTGLSIVEELAGGKPRVPDLRKARLRHLLGRLSGGRFNLPDPEDYGSHDYLYRRNVEIRKYYEEILGATQPLSADYFDFEVIRGFLGKQRRGGSLISSLVIVLAWELWLQQLKARRWDC